MHNEEYSINALFHSARSDIAGFSLSNISIQACIVRTLRLNEVHTTAGTPAATKEILSHLPLSVRTERSFLPSHVPSISRASRSDPHQSASALESFIARFIVLWMACVHASVMSSRFYSKAEIPEEGYHPSNALSNVVKSGIVITLGWLLSKHIATFAMQKGDRKRLTRNGEHSCPSRSALSPDKLLKARKLS